MSSLSTTNCRFMLTFISIFALINLLQSSSWTLTTLPRIDIVLLIVFNCWIYKRFFDVFYIFYKNAFLTFLGRIAIVAQRPIVIKLSRGRSVGLCVGSSVGLSSVLSKNGGSDPDTVWHHRSDGSRNEAGSKVWGSVHGKGYFWWRIWGAPL